MGEQTSTEPQPQKQDQKGLGHKDHSPLAHIRSLPGTFAASVLGQVPWVLTGAGLRVGRPCLLG